MATENCDRKWRDEQAVVANWDATVNSLGHIYEKEMTGCELTEIESGTSENQMSKGSSVFIYLHRMTGTFMSVKAHHRGHTLTIAVLTRSLQAPNHSSITS